MHTRILAAGADRYVHAVVRLNPRVSPLPADASAHLRAVLQALAVVPGATLSKRVQYHPDTGTAVTYQCLAPAAAETSVRSSFEMLTRGPGLTLQAQMPDDDRGFGVLLETVLPCQALVAPARYVVGDVWLACPWRAADLWPRLVADAAGADLPLAYQSNLYAFQPPPAQLRGIALNLDRLARRPGIPQRLHSLQAEVAARSRHCRWLAEDIVMAATLSQRAALQMQVDAWFRCAHQDIGDGPTLAFGETALQDNLSLACDYDEVWADDPPYVASQALDLASGLACLDADDDLTAVPVHVPETARAASAAPIDTPYVFLSYAHADRSRTLQVRESLRAQGIPVWMDEQLQGGEEWDAVLEQRIRESHLVLVLMSPAAAQSRFVRRELRYADAMSRRILCLRLQPTELGDGMAMLLLPLQWIDDWIPGAQQRLLDAARRWLGEPLRGTTAQG